MMNGPKIILSILLVLLLAGCDGETAGTDTPTPAPAVNTPTLAPPPDTPTVPPPTNTLAAPSPTASPVPATSTPPQPTATIPPATSTPPMAGSPTPADRCILTALGEVTVFTRPHPEADVFGFLAAGGAIEVAAVTPNVWFGFDPGVAQAPNVGPFRLRWIPTSPAFVLEGGTCEQLPVIEGPPPGVCFAMVHEEIPVLAEPDPAAEVVVGLSADDYAAAIGKSGDEWYQVDLNVGSEGLDQIGWITGFIDFNGPCQDLPEVGP